MPTTPPLEPQPYLTRFGLSEFRPGQHEVISAVLGGQDCLCIMPTGGGKSLCYQLPAIAREGLTLVVSPLIALMKDQVDALGALGLKATFINSSLSAAEQRLRLANMAAGHYDLVYVAPERLRNTQFLEAIRAARLQLLAVDEAHCISEWGHDFRPDYARLGRFRARLKYPQTIALTATATPEVRQDVVQLLELRNPKVFVSGFARPNLRFEVREPGSTREKDAMLLEFLRENPGAGIVYASTRKKCSEVMTRISQALKRNVGFYHAGLLPEERTRVQDDFMQDRLQIIVATNAFGMGIDKRDLRFVVHYNMPGSLEAYYQEAGRAGRDGQPARCLLLYSYQDRFIQEFFIENAYPSPDIVAEVYEYLRHEEQDPIEITLEELKEQLELSIGTEGVGSCERLLEKCGALERLDSRENKASVRIDSDLPTLVDLLPKEAKIQRKVLRQLEQEVGDLRHERVYFSLERIAAMAELDRDAVLRALRELTRLKAFDYAPAFRGRAIHMMEREKPFEALDIDFEELERRRQAEFDKLERVIHFARTASCRQLEILDYFGDPDRSRCGVCDNCVAKGKSARPVDRPALLAARPTAARSQAIVTEEDRRGTPPAGLDDEALVEAVRMVLSGVARTHGRFGKNLVAQMLWGSKSANITKYRLDQLSTYGLLHHVKQDEVLLLIDKLLAAGLLAQTERERYRPLVHLTDLGGNVMRGSAELEDDLDLPPLLLTKLRHKPRRTSGRFEGETPSGPSPKAAKSVVSPPAAPELSSIAGPASWLARTSQDAGPTRPGPDPPEFATAAVKPSFYWTWRLLSTGYTRAECEQIRGCDAARLLDQALQAAEHNLPVRAEWFLTPQQIAELTALIGDTTPPQLRPILEQVSPGLTRQHVQLFVRCRG